MYTYSLKDRLCERAQRKKNPNSRPSGGAPMRNVAPSQESKPLGAADQLYLDVTRRLFGDPSHQNSNFPNQQASKPSLRLSFISPYPTRNHPINRNTINLDNQSSLSSHPQPSNISSNNHNQLENTGSQQNKFTSNFPANNFQNQNQNQNNFTIEHSPATRINLNSQSRQLPQNSNNFSSNNNNNNSNFQNNMTSNFVSVYNNNNNLFNNTQKHNSNDKIFNKMDHHNFSSETATSMNNNVNANVNNYVNDNQNVSISRNLFGYNNPVQSNSNNFTQNNNNNCVGPFGNQSENHMDTNFNTYANSYMFMNNNNNNYNNNNNNNNMDNNNNNNNIQFQNNNNFTTNQQNFNNFSNQQPQFCNNSNNNFNSPSSSYPFSSNSHSYSNYSPSFQQQSSQVLNPEQQFYIQAHDFVKNQLLPLVQNINQNGQYSTNQQSQQKQWREKYESSMQRRKDWQFEENMRKYNEYCYRRSPRKPIVIIKQAPKITEQQRIRREIQQKQREKARRDYQYEKQHGMSYDHHQLYLQWQQHHYYRQFTKKQQLEKKLPSDFPFSKLDIKISVKPLNCYPSPQPNNELIPQKVNMDYVIYFNWLENPTHVSPVELTGRVQVSARPSQKEVKEAVQLDLSKNWLRDINRKYCVNVSIYNYKTYVPNSFMRMLGYKNKLLYDINMRGSVIVPKINLPEGYGYSPKQFRGCIVRNLQIFNRHGKITWTSETNLQFADFSKNISIHNNDVECEIPELKKQALVQFYGIPNLATCLPEHLIENRLRKTCKKGTKFSSMNWNKKSWSIIVDFSVYQSLRQSDNNNSSKNDSETTSLELTKLKQ